MRNLTASNPERSAFTESLFALPGIVLVGWESRWISKIGMLEQ
ncbi:MULTISPECIES: hypothetical protein [unclassified Mesorhizobium]|nr:MULTISPECIES: hypothetical protein [unclassified Mesorhizobium]